MSDQHRAPPVSPADHILGDAAASVTLIEYGDFECPYCGQAHPVLARIRERMGRRLRFVFRHFPIATSHAHAEHAAEAAESVAAQGGEAAFWTMHDLMFAHQRALEDDDLAQYARQAGVDGTAVLQDLADARYQDRVRASFMSGIRSGVNGTPSLFIDGIRYDGPRDEETLLAALSLVADETDNSRASL